MQAHPITAMCRAALNWLEKGVDFVKQSTEQSILLSALHQAQERDGYLTAKAIDEIARKLDIPAAEVYETASFYAMFYLEPQGRHKIQICESAPCHIAGAQAIVDMLERELGIQMGQTTADGKITLEYIQCCGQCQDAPVILVDGQVHGQVTAEQIPEILNGLQ